MHHYLDPRILRIYLLGISSGLPWVLVGSFLTLWLKDAGLSRSSIGYAGAIYAVYSINFIWSPLIDQIKRPFFFPFGQRKSWIILCQLSMIAGCYLVSQTDPGISASLTVLACLFIAFFSATQDIAIDAYRIDSIPESEEELVSLGAAMATAGWWTGQAGIGAIALIASERLGLSWPQLYIILNTVITLLILTIIFFPEPESINRENHHLKLQQKYIVSILQQKNLKKIFVLLSLLSPVIFTLWTMTGGAGIPDSIKEFSLYVPLALLTGALLLLFSFNRLNLLLQSNAEIPDSRLLTNTTRLDRIIAWFAVSVIHPFLNFFKRNGTGLAIKLLLFILLFKIGEAFLGRMSLVFYKEVGFSNEDIAYYSKLITFGVTILFSLISGLFMAKFGLIKGLFIAGIAMASSNLMFSALAYVGPEKWLFALTVIVDGFTSAWGSVALVAFLSSLCDRNYTATQYAVLASIANLGRTLFASASGTLVDSLNGNWFIFFILTALLVIPSLLLLLSMSNKIHSSK